MTTGKPLISLAIALVTLICSQADARQIESWSFQRLHDAADVVIVVTLASTTEWPEKLKHDLYAEDLEGQLSTFDVETAFKGQDIGKQIQVVHYRRKEGRASMNGPLVASFRKTGRRLEIESVDGVKERTKVMESTPNYLLFLKKRSDGKYEPVSGQVDSALSVRKLSGIDPLMDSP